MSPLLICSAPLAPGLEQVTASMVPEDLSIANIRASTSRHDLRATSASCPSAQLMNFGIVFGGRGQRKLALVGKKRPIEVAGVAALVGAASMRADAKGA
jgi:hypothetical protein